MSEIQLMGGNLTLKHRYFDLIQFIENSFYLRFNVKTDPERRGRELSIALLFRVKTCREGARTPLLVSGQRVNGGRPLGSATSHTRYFGLKQLFEKSFCLFFNLKTDPGRGGRQLSIALFLGSRHVGKVPARPFKFLGRG